MGADTPCFGGLDHRYERLLVGMVMGADTAPRPHPPACQVSCIAAASIVAKVTRDRMMIKYDKEYPAYGFAQHKGYGTAAQ